MTTGRWTMKVQIAWWLKPYLYTLAAFCAITGHEPDETKLARIIDRAITPRFKKS